MKDELITFDKIYNLDDNSNSNKNEVEFEFNGVFFYETNVKIN